MLTRLALDVEIYLHLMLWFKKTLSMLTGMYLFGHLIRVVMIAADELYWHCKQSVCQRAVRWCMRHTICSGSPRHTQSLSWFLIALSGRECVCLCIDLSWSSTLSFSLLWVDIIQHVPCWLGSWMPPHHTYTLLSAQGVYVCVANLYVPTHHTQSP